MLLGAADLWEEAWSAAVGQVLGLGGSSVSSFALTMESFHLCCWNSHSHWEVVYCFSEGFRTQTLVFSDIFCLSEHTWLKLQCGVAVAFEITVSLLAVCVFFRCGSASPSVCKPWAVLGKGRLWKAELKQSCCVSWDCKCLPSMWCCSQAGLPVITPLGRAPRL